MPARDVTLASITALATATSASAVITPFFSVSQSPPDILSPSFAITDDLDGDGDEDIIAITDFGPIVWYENDSTQTPPIFTLHTIAEADETFSPSTAYPGDFTGNGLKDILVAQRLTDDILLFESRMEAGELVFDRTVLIPGGGGTLQAVPVDLDGDGDLDILFDTYQQALQVVELGWFENKGGDPLEFQLHIIDATIYNNAVVLTPADLDLDGDMDFIGGSGTTTARCDPNQNTATWYENSGTTPPFFIPRRLGNSTCVVTPHVGDMNGDGWPDIVTIGEFIDIFVNPGPGSTDFEQINVFTPNEFTQGVAFDGDLADIDGNGALDILLDLQVPSSVGMNQGGFAAVWLLNVDNFFPDFRPFAFPGTLEPASQIEAADFDGDGDFDVFLFSETGDKSEYIDNRLITCPGNCDGNASIGFSDLVCILFNFGESTPVGSLDCDDSGVVDFDDIICTLFLFGPCDG